MAVEHIRVTTSDGAVLNAFCEGNGPALMLISGLGGAAGFWAQISKQMSREFRVIRFDQRGIAGSTRGAAACTIATLAQDALAVLSAFDVHTACVLGHSTGGCIVQAMAQDAAAKIRGAILSATWIKAGPYMQALFSLRQTLLAMNPQTYAESAALLSYPPEWLEQHWDIYERAAKTSPRDDSDRLVVAERIAALLSHDGQAMLSALKMPVLVLGAEDDMIVPAFHQRELAAALPHSELLMLPRGGHFFPVSAADTFVTQVGRFARGIS